MHTPRLSEAAVAFPRGLRVDLGIHTLFFISGTASVGPEGQSMHEGDFYAQVIHTYKNIASLLHEQSAAFKDIVRFTVYLKSMDYYDKFNKARDDFFANQGLSREEFPASTCVEARLCREELLVEIEAIAIIK
ncbi:MAG: RidA family protein [PVC group bacterium]|nr:RidA family protein [PVC group bacterium]